MSQNPNHDPTVALWNELKKPGVWKGIWGFIRLFWLLLFELPYYVIDSLIHVGRGAKNHSLILFLAAGAPMLLIAAKVQTPAGDALFFLWAVFTAKWIAERVWLTRRTRSNPNEHRYHPGVGLFTAIGIRGDRTPYLLLLLLGIFISAYPGGYLVGTVLFLGSIGGLIIETIIGHQIKEAAGKRRDGRILMEMQAQSDDHTQNPSPSFQDVRIE